MAKRALKIRRLELTQFALGLAFLVAGTGVYLLDRPLASTDLFRHQLWLEAIVDFLPNPYVAVGPVAPEFFHPLALSLISASLFPELWTKRILCAAWLTLDAAVEVGQAFGPALSRHLPDTVTEVTVIGYFANFLARGTFDPLDLLAITLGSLTAFLIIETGSRRRANT